MSDDKTEEPTEKKLSDARKDGKVSQSRDLTEAIAFLAPVGVLDAMSGHIQDNLRGIMRLALNFVHSEHSTTNVMAQVSRLVVLMVGAIFPLLAAAALASLVGSIAQVGFQVSMKPVIPNLANINPASGIKKIVSVQSLIELLKTLLKSLIVSVVVWKTVEGMLPLIAASPYQSVPDIAKLVWYVLLRLFLIVPFVFFVFGIVDIKIQRRSFLKGMKMSKHEIKREYKESEGDPMLKGERKRIARELVLSPPASQRTATANMLVTNPTHYAVAVRYQPREHPLPRVVAKATDGQVEVLRNVARDAGVPIIGNPSVARALYKVGIDEPIPEALFEVVAAILRWLEVVGPHTATRDSQ